MCRETNYELRFMATSSDDILAFNYLSVILALILKSGMMLSQTCSNIPQTYLFTRNTDAWLHMVEVEIHLTEGERGSARIPTVGVGKELR